MPGDKKLPDDWSAEAKFAVVLETAALSEIELSEYCRRKGLYPDQVQAWRQACISGQQSAQAQRQAEREAILAVCNSPEYAHLPPSQIVPRLADEGCYLASESTFYRVLHAADQQHRRGRSQPPRTVKAPTSHVATAANQVWPWDITYLPAAVRGQYFYLYLIEDIYSRKTVGWEVHEQESAKLLQRSVLSEQCPLKPPVLHSDNGAPMKSATMLQKMYDLGVTPSHSRSRVRDDNPYSESLFRTLKYCPQWPKQGFADLEAARSWGRDFIRWYNHEHRQSVIGGEDHHVLARRHALYQEARGRMPERWSGATRNWEPVGAVTLNPEREQKQPLKQAA